jgi:hypothetical protein
MPSRNVAVSSCIFLCRRLPGRRQDQPRLAPPGGWPASALWEAKCSMRCPANSPLAPRRFTWRLVAAPPNLRTVMSPEEYDALAYVSTRALDRDDNLVVTTRSVDPQQGRTGECYSERVSFAQSARASGKTFLITGKRCPPN